MPGDGRAPAAGHAAAPGRAGPEVWRDDPVLARFRAAVEAAYGARLERLVLYGSRARGEARADSDYDVAVFLRDLGDPWAEMDRLADIATDVLYDIGGVVHAVPFPPAPHGDAAPLASEVRLDGVAP